MKKIKGNDKLNLTAGLSWEKILCFGMIGQSFNGILSLVNQIVYRNNENPYYSSYKTYNDSASKLFVRAQNYAFKSTLSFGNPYL